MTTKPVGDESLEDRLTESIWAISDGAHPAKDVLRKLIRGILSAAGPVGGAGELTALADAQQVAYHKCLQIVRRHAGAMAQTIQIEIAKLAESDYRAALAAKAPQGVPATSKLADEVNQCLQIILTNAGNLEDGGKERTAIEEAVDRAAKATWAALRCSEATPASKLPVPGPVSDDTIHHGMVPPTYTGHKLLQLTCNHERSTDTASCECGWQKEFATCGGAFDGWLEHASSREAAAPKPAPPDDSSFDLGKAVKNMHDLQKVGEAMGLGATPAPGAERLRETLRLRAEELHVDQNGSGLPLKGYSDCHRHIFETCTSPKCVEVREALAAAPPAPNLPPDERLSKIINDFIDVPATEPTRFNKFFHALERHIEQVAGDRHASAERVRQLELTLKNLTLHMGAQLNIIIERSNRQKGSARNRTRRYAGTVEEWLRMAREALPPSTGEKA